MSAPTAWDARSPELQTLLELGQGGMATAYLARALGAGGFERLVVLKRLSLELLGNQEALDRFLAEARVAAQLHHVNIVGTHQIGRDAAGPFIVLDYVEGGSLEDLVNASRARGELLPVPVVLRVALDALAGLRAVHEATDGSGRPLAILHRDVSLQNVLVSLNDGVTRLSDFGVAKSSFSRIRTDPRCFVGKLLYFSPEYLLGETVGPQLDLYGLGVTLWLALTGDELWPGQNERELVRSIANQGVPPLAGRVEAAPEIRAFVARACARAPRDRFLSAREMTAVLEYFDRHCGWVASYSDVAACVERLLGKALARRRESLAELAPDLDRGRRVSEQAPSLHAELARTVPVAPSPPREVATPHVERRARPWVFWAVGLGTLALLTLALGSAARPPSTPNQGMQNAIDVPAARAPRAPATSAPELSAGAVEYAAPAPASAVTRAEADVTPRRSARPRPAAHRLSGAPQTAASGPAPALPGQDIRRQNPYR
jgi:serine/threonine protein kinase